MAQASTPRVEGPSNQRCCSSERAGPEGVAGRDAGEPHQAAPPNPTELIAFPPGAGKKNKKLRRQQSATSRAGSRIKN